MAMIPDFVLDTFNRRMAALKQQPRLAVIIPKPSDPPPPPDAEERGVIEDVLCDDS